MSSYGTVTVAATATLIVAANTNRKDLELNNVGAVVVYLGMDNSVTTSNGFSLYEDSFRDIYKGSTGNYLGDVYGIAASGTADVRYWEVT